MHTDHDPEDHDFVSGPAEEFAMFDPMGFAEAEAGESFVKIGVGLLMKDEDKEYRFDGNYKLIRAGNWDIEHKSDRVEFRGDAPITRMVFWAVERAVCLEPFIALSMAPGQAQEWSSCYRFSEF